MNTSIVSLLEENKASLYNDWKEQLNSITDPHIEEFKGNHSLNEEAFSLIINSLKKYDTEDFSELRDFYNKLLKKEWSLNYLTSAFQQFRRSALQIILKEDIPREEIMTFYEEIDGWFDPILMHLVNDCSESWRTRFEEQKQAVQELTAPIIPVFDKICVLPLIGVIDSERAETIKENLLNGIISTRSEYVLIDITGVPVVDTYVSNYLMQATQAANMLGSTCIIVGIRPEIAQTLVNLGVTLNVLTFANLNKGIQYALGQTQRTQ
ncbi:STAS domain-containing protein [Priestia koreensis]|uniref:STAS domain-containing protein n=1 Tax=Priestia koreensis TaxID=284581 RepID=UPI003015C82A